MEVRFSGSQTASMRLTDLDRKMKKRTAYATNSNSKCSNFLGKVEQGEVIDLLERSGLCTRLFINLFSRVL